ncbi:LysR family transcriptional regulator [Brevibacillus ginsengisoli]|uniref:LysR family transcriptional regulator n=1 Tax=Brevibacillus ginsengisoli TaxID=363854 RepID=UPI003CF4B3C0
MTFTQLQVFRAVAELESFSKAGEFLGISQPGISHAISGLESELGTILIKRNRNGITLTKIGEQLLTHVHEILNRQEQMIQEVAVENQKQKGIIRIGCISSVSSKWLPRVIGSFRKLHPEIEVIVTEGSNVEIKNWIFIDTIHLGFISTKLEELDSLDLLNEEIMVLLPQDHRLANEKHLLIDQLADEPFIMPAEGCQTMVKDIFSSKNLQPKVQFEIRETTTILEMVQEGLGVTLLPELALPVALERVQLLSLSPRKCRKVRIAARNFKTISPACKLFMEHVEKWVSQYKDEKW